MLHPKKKAAIAQYGLILRERHIIINIRARSSARFCDTTAGLSPFPKRIKEGPMRDDEIITANKS
jgi:hypothetical protein